LVDRNYLGIGKGKIKMIFNVRLSYTPEHFNRTCNALIPADWTAETFDHPEANRVYGMDQWSADEAIKDLISQLREDGLSGTLKINRIHTNEDQKRMDAEAAKDLQNDKIYQSYWE
jgi:hypothetical protein